MKNIIFNFCFYYKKIITPQQWATQQGFVKHCKDKLKKKP